jgi:serine/threonine protein kinase
MTARLSKDMGDTVRIGNFQVLGELGTGANSKILHIRRSADSKQYALKVVPINGPKDLKYLEQAQYEFRVARMLDHPNLIRIYALETPRDWLFRIRKVHLLIEYVNGKTLDKLPRIPLPQLVQVFVRVASGLVHMHRRGVYHADLKPNNILLSRTGDVKIIDYGLAWIRGEAKGRVQGTPEYMAPEQARKATVNERTDIFNFGATMYRLVTFRKPPSMLNPNAPAAGPPDGLVIDAKTWQRLLKPVQECNPEAPAPLCELIYQCLAFKPQSRPERMSEIQGALDHLADELIRSPEDKLDAYEWE